MATRHSRDRQWRSSSAKVKRGPGNVRLEFGEVIVPETDSRRRARYRDIGQAAPTFRASGACECPPYGCRSHYHSPKPLAGDFHAFGPAPVAESVWSRV